MKGVEADMSLCMTKKDIEKLNALKRKQKAINKKRAEFKKQILENKELVRMILAEDEAQERHLVGQRAQAVQGVQGGVPPAF